MQEFQYIIMDTDNKDKCFVGATVKSLVKQTTGTPIYASLEVCTKSKGVPCGLHVFNNVILKEV